MLPEFIGYDLLAVPVDMYLIKGEIPVKLTVPVEQMIYIDEPHAGFLADFFQLNIQPDDHPVLDD